MPMSVFSQVLYRSRRGIKELDLILIPFSEKQYPLLDAHEQELYQTLLSQEDQLLWDWFFLLDFPAKLEYQQLITDILNYYRVQQQESVPSEQDAR